MRSFRTALLGAIALAAAATASAAPFPDPQANAPRALGQSEIVADFAVGNFLENLVVTASGDIIATDFVAKTLWRINPETGARTAFAAFDRNIAGVVAYRGGYLVTSPSETGSVVYFVSRAGAVSEFVALPAGVYSNGIAVFGGNRFLIADSAGGGVWLLNARTRETTNWVRDERLTPAGASSPFIPAANGVRRQGDYVYVSSMHRQLLLRARINRDGSAGPLETIAENVFLDDFTVGSDGVVFATTHVFDSVLRITPDGQVTTVADHSNGLRGPTSISFGPRRGGVQSFYVSNNGQLYIQPATGPETGRLVRIDLPTDLARR